MRQTFPRLTACLLAVVLLLNACAPVGPSPIETFLAPTESPPTPVPLVTPLPTRAPFPPGELVDYIAQTGDTLPALAVHFNTRVEEIRLANPIIPDSATTMPPGMPMKIPIYSLPLWGSTHQIIPDEHFINSPAQINFDTAGFVASQTGWLRDYQEDGMYGKRSTAEIIDTVALNYSVSPRLLLALIEYQAGGLSQPFPSAGIAPYFLGVKDYAHRSLYTQLNSAANALNNGFYAWRLGRLTTIMHPDGHMERPDPWQNAATVALQNYFSVRLNYEHYLHAISSEGLSKVFQTYFGDPWEKSEPHIPASLEQPEFKLPFELGKVWAYTGGPHTGWGNGEPYTALDFAPPSVMGGCVETKEWATALASGVVVRSVDGVLVLDLDGDGDERTGWTIFYLHLANDGRLAVGSMVEAGDRVGHPSCEGGTSTGTHVHIARKYNGEWIPAAGVLAFNLDGWIAQEGSAPYQGTLVRLDKTVIANTGSSSTSHIRSSGE